MRRTKSVRVLFLILAAALLAGGSLASVASAKHLSKSQKTKIRAKLRRELKANPRVVLKRSFAKQAGQVSFTLPVTLRFRKSDTGTPSTLSLDLGTLGVKTIALDGYLPANATFIDPSASGSLGELRVSIPSQAPGTVGGITPGPNGVQYDGGTATLRANPLTILTNPDVTGKTIAQGGCSDYNTAGLGTPGSPGAGVGGGGYLPAASDAPDNPAYNAAIGTGVDPNAVFRTPWLPVGVAPVGTQVANGLSNTQTFTGPSGGTAYLFGNPSGPGVDVTLNALTNINSILRDVDTENGLFVALGRQCSQTWTGAVPNVLTAHVTGSLDIRPDVTNDGRLRLAVATLSGGGVPDTITACVAPYSQYAAPSVPAGSALNITGLAQNPFAGVGVSTAVLTEAIPAGTPQAAPQVPCGAYHVGAGGQPTVGVGANTGLGGNVALFGTPAPGDNFPSANTPINGAPSGLPGVTVPQPCTTPAGSSTIVPATGYTQNSGCEISLNGTLTPGTITADVLIGTPTATDKPAATNNADHFSPSPQVQGLVGNL